MQSNTTSNTTFSVYTIYIICAKSDSSEISLWLYNSTQDYKNEWREALEIL
jgi:hypothetical protein